MNFLEIKPLVETLLPAVLELDHRCLGGLWTLQGYQRELESPNSDLLVLLDASGNLLGFGCLWAILEEAHITILAVQPDYQRQGLGQVLLYALLRSAERRGLERATLEVRVSNQAGLTLYRKFGFREVGIRRRYYQDTDEDALILWRGDLQRSEFQQRLLEWQQQICDRLQQSGWHLSPSMDAYFCAVTP